MQVLAYLLPGLILGLISYFLLTPKKTIIMGIWTIIEFVLGYNFLFLGMQKFIFHKDDILNPQLYDAKFCRMYIFQSLCLGIIYLIIKGLANRTITVTKEQQSISKKEKYWMWIFKIATVLFVALGATFKYFGDWFINYFGNITPEQFFFNVQAPLQGTEQGIARELITNPVFHIVTAVLITIFVIQFSYNVYFSFKNKRYLILKKKVYNLLIFSLAVILMISGIAYGSNKLHLKEVFRSYFDESSYFADHYVDPRDVQLTFPKQKRNLIHIYLESMENSYMTQDLGGYMTENLTPELTELLNQGDSFSNNDVYGGPNQSYGASWSIAAMVNMMAGVPMKISQYGHNGSFLPGAITIGDILEAAGYEQTIMFGSDINFQGIDAYFTQHGNYTKFDLKYAKEKGLIPEDYYEWWGFEDEKLFEYAKNEITRLADTGKPFSFTMETADTHFPDGWLSPNAPTPFEAQYANVIAFSSKQASDFIKWLQEQPFYENTTVVVTGDHLSMDTNFFAGFDPNYRRSIYNVILNSAAKPANGTRFKNREYAPFDFYPTILESMGIKIKGDRLGLGTNLYSNKKTLIENEGLDKVNEQLSLKSDYFLDELINPDKTSVLSTKKFKTKN